MKDAVRTILILVIFSAAVAAGEPNAPSAVTLTVSVVNATAGGTSVSGDRVVVGIYEHMNPRETLEAAADEQGNAVFPDIPVGPRTVALPRARHGDIMFGGSPVLLSGGGPHVSASVRVHDVSTDRSRLVVGTHHIFVKIHGARVRVTEDMNLKNPTDRAISSDVYDEQGRPVVVAVELPAGYHGLRTSGYLEEGEVVATDGGFYDTMAMPPGEYQLTFAYDLDINGPAVPIRRPVHHPTANLIVLAELTGGLSITGLGEPQTGPHGQDGRPITFHRRSDLKGGDVVEFAVEGFRFGTSYTIQWVALGVVFAALMVMSLVKFARPQPS